MTGITHKASKCVHHWIIGDFVHSDGHGDYNYEPGQCKKCGVTKRFRSRGKLGPSGTGHWGLQFEGWDEEKYDQYKREASAAKRDRGGRYVATDSRGRDRGRLGRRGVSYASDGRATRVPQRNP